MEKNHIMMNQKLLEKSHDLRKQKLEVFDILREALIVSFKNFSFIIFIFLASLPFFGLMVYYETFLQRTLVEASHILKHPPSYSTYNWPLPEFLAETVTKDFFHELVQLSFLYLVPLHLFELCTVIVTVDLASKIYAEETPMTLKEMIHKPIYGARLRGTFVTSFYVLFLSTCTQLGLIWLVTNYYVIFVNSVVDVLFAVSYGAAFAALLTKLLEWSAMWNMSIVISTLEGLYGVEAFALSAYFSKGVGRRGLLLMLVFFVWGQSLRLPCLYFGCYGGRGTVAQICLFCLGNVLKWVVCTVYFYDCKKRILEKKVDEEVERDIDAIDA